MSSQPTLRVWIDPWKYFSATARLSREEAGNLIERVYDEIEAGDEEALRQFEFVSLENPYFAWKQLRRSRNRPPINC